MIRKAIWAAVLLVPFLAADVAAQKQAEFIFEGSASCKKCHLTKKTGAAFKIWQKSAHANAFATLATPEAKKIASAKGIEDPQKADACLKCHVTAFGVPAARLGKKFSHAEGVGCEVCHGPGSVYNDKKVKKAVMAGEMTAASVGLKKGSEEDCLKCHNKESPTFKPFDYKEQFAKIAHAKPKK